MTAVLDRSVAILELLATHAEGLPLHEVADRLTLPRSATHRLLNDLARHGYVRQDREQGPYVLTTKLVTLAFTFLSRSGIVDVAQPVLDRLAQQTGELVRLGVIDGERLTWVAKAQGARSGLRYDPDMGMEAQLSCTANGHAWLAALTDEQALSLVARQGFGKPGQFGPNAPRTVAALLKRLKLARDRGYATVSESSAPGTAAIAAVVRRAGNGEPAGVLSIAGPVVRLTEKRMQVLAPALLAAARELAAVSGGPSVLGATASGRIAAKVA